MSVFLSLEKIKQAFAKLPLMLICVLGIALLSNAYATEPSNQATSADSAIDGKSTVGKKLKCRRIKQLGTNIAKKVCDSEENWEALNDKRGGVDEYTRTIQQRATITGPGNVDAMGGTQMGPLGGP